MWEIVLNALASSALAAAIIALFGLVFRSYAVRWVNHQFDERLETIKAEHRKQEETLKGDLAKQRSQIEALQSGALSGMAARNALLDKRRIEALERVWTAAAYIQPYHNVVSMCSAIGFDELSKVARGSKAGPAIIDGFLQMAPPFADLGKQDSPLSGIDREQLFLPPLVWAMFDAYRTVVFLPMAMLISIKGGHEVKDMWDAKRVQHLLRAALPDVEFDLTNQGTADLGRLAGTLKSRLLAIALGAIESPEVDTKSVEQAAEIVRSAQTLQASTVAASNPAVAALRERE